ncbi:MAG: rod shape-determining protein MreD [Candidatus Cloacimonetes bacterium]|nr:rod shape-determining protein MreD [Candidatus Cloacimonadota bacterium]
MIWKHLWTFILGLVCFYAQVLLLPAFELFGVIPNILIAWVVYLVWTRELTPALIVIFIIGLLYDTTQPESFGMHALVLLLIAIALYQFRKPFESESVLARMLSLVLANLIFQLVAWLVLGVVYGFSGELAVLSLIGFAYGLVASFAVFWILQLGSRLRIVLLDE